MITIHRLNTGLERLSHVQSTAKRMLHVHAFLTPQEAWQWTGAREASDIFIPEDPIFDPKSLVLQQTQQVSQSRQWGFK